MCLLMIEVENKYVLSDSKDKHFLSIAEKKDIHFSLAKNQVDMIYVSKNMEGFKINPGDPVVRIRTVAGESILTLKKKENKNMVELELGIEQPQIMDEILKNLGLKKAVTVDKTRKEAQYHNINICYDEIKDLGKYLELEILVKSEKDVAEARKKIDKLAETFDLEKKDIESKLYDTLVYEKKHD